MTLTSIKKIINPYYWEEKLKSVSKFGGPAKEYSESKLKANIKHHFDNYFKDSDDEELKKETWEEIENDILGYLNDYSPEVIYSKIYDFKHKDFIFEDFHYDNTIYTHHYIWICYAIVWGILEYEYRFIKKP